MDAISYNADAAPVWHRLPAWLLSLAMHLAAVVLACLLIRPAPPPKEFDEQNRPAAIVLTQRGAEKTIYYTDEAPASISGDTEKAGGGVPAGGGLLVDSNRPPGAAGISLPQLPGSLPGGEGAVASPQPGNSRGRPRLPFSTIDEAAILAEDARIPREVIPNGPTAKLSLFGSAQAEGRSFVLAIDRSQSMGGDGLGAIRAASKELAERIDGLTPEQTFQVVAYNQSAVYFTGRELISATDDNKQSLLRYIANLVAFGQTEHERGLLAALRLKPEVIFLLTDGGDPHLKPGQLTSIRETAAGKTSIHALHFGDGATGEAPPNHFLRRLAAENGGSYLYIDMSGR